MDIQIVMLKEKGIVLQMLGDRVRVAVRRSGACRGCSEMTHGCACSLMGNDPEAVVTAFNEAGAKIGDMVELSLPEGALLWASVAAYLLPVILLTAGSVGGHLLSDRLSISADVAAIMGAAAGLAFGVSATWMVSRYAARTGRTTPRITGVLIPSNVLAGNDQNGERDQG